MDDFIFNDCDICLNPNTIFQSLSEDKKMQYAAPYFEISTASFKGKWLKATNLSFPTWGSGSGVYKNDKKVYNTEKEAVKAAATELIAEIDRHVRWSNNKDYNSAEKKLVERLKNIIHPVPVELSLF